jgi:hypothetical protein
MIIIQTESGSIVTDPKEIYIGKDLAGHLHIYADLSSTDRVKAVELTINDYSEAILDQILEMLYRNMDEWLSMNKSRHYLIRMEDVTDI